MEHSSTQGAYKGSNNLEQKLQESKKSRKDERIGSAMQLTNPLKF